jgi:putative inorganic carbon (hco3(-)) transporter
MLGGTAGAGRRLAVTTIRARSASPFLIAGAGLASAIALGLTASFDLRIAFTLALALTLLPVLALWPTVILSALVLSLFVEIVSLGGVTIGRMVAPVALLIVLWLATRGAASIRYGPQIGWALAYALWALASGLWTVDLGSTVYELGSLAIALIFMVAFAAALNTRKELDRVLRTLALASLAVGLFAIGAFAAGYSGALDQGRAAGGTGDPNFFATYQVMAFPLVLVLAGESRRGWLRLALYATVLVIIGSVLVSVSRGGLVTLATILILLALLPARTLLPSRSQKALLLVLVTLGTAVTLKETASDILPRLKAVYTHQGTAEARGSGRTDIWLAAGTAIRRHPVEGLGYGGFPSSSNELLLETPGVDLTTYELGKGEEAHSVYFGTTAELGLVGLGLLLGLVASTVKALRRTAAAALEIGHVYLARVANALVLSLAGWAIASLFLSSQNSRALWIVIGLSLALPKLLPTRRPH